MVLRGGYTRVRVPPYLPGGYTQGGYPSLLRVLEAIIDGFELNVWSWEARPTVKRE